jgi:hypothetical protein
MTSRKNLLWGFFLVFGFYLHQGNAQEETIGHKVKERTLMEHYAPELVLPADERRQLKVERYYWVTEREAVIDTLDISNRKKRRLLKELHRSPFSDHYDKVLGSLYTEEGSEENPD